jgi:RimJ/RimL family protein N-acetyltransferase
MTPADARAIGAWRYAGEYAVYNHGSGDRESDGTSDADAEMLDRRSPYYTVRDPAGELIGYFVFGTAAELGSADEPHLLGADGTLSIGLGLRPDLTGRGRGLAFVQAGLDFALLTFAPSAFRLFVLSFNQRATRVYERAGFLPAGSVYALDAGIEREFVEMRRAAGPVAASDG